MPQQDPRLRSVAPRGLAVPSLAVLASGLTLAGCFLTLVRTEQLLNGTGSPAKPLVTTSSPWRNRIALPDQSVIVQPAVPVGIPLLVAATLLAAAAIVGAWSASTGSTGTLARRLTSGGAIFLAGVVATVGMSGVPRAIGSVTITLESGMWLLIGAVVVAFAAAIVGHLRARKPPGGQAHPDAAFAPPSDVVITVLPPEPPPASPPTP